MKPTIPEHKRQQAEQIRRDREAWLAQGNQVKELTPAGQEMDRKAVAQEEWR